MCRDFLQCETTALQNHSPIAIRHSLPFLARQEPRPPNFSLPRVPCPIPFNRFVQVSSNLQPAARQCVENARRL